MNIPFTAGDQLLAADLSNLGLNGGLYAADAGSTDAYAITTASPALTAYSTGLKITFKANTVNTGTATLNVNGLGAKTIVSAVNTTLTTGDIAAGQICTVIYDGTNFVLQNGVSKGYADSDKYISSSASTTTAIPTGANWAMVQGSFSSAHSSNYYTWIVSANFTPSTMATATPTNSIESVSATATWSGGNLVITSSGTINSVIVAFYR